MSGALAGKVALVTGAASGIGLATALLFAREGAQVAAADIDTAGLAAHPDLFALQLDVSDEDGWIAAAEHLRARFGRLDVLVNNAGILLPMQMVTDLALADWRRLMAINLDGVFLGTKHILPLIRESTKVGGGGSVVNVSSMAGIRPSPGSAAYGASKGAVRLFTKAVALECAAAKDGVRINSIHPGLIETPILDNVTGGKATLESVVAKGVPLGRLGRADEVAAGILYLASDASSYMTGSELVLDGGRIA